jgi:hypothetical protein
MPSYRSPQTIAGNSTVNRCNFSQFGLIGGPFRRQLALGIRGLYLAARQQDWTRIPLDLRRILEALHYSG